MRLLGLLRERPATATQLAVRTGRSSGATSYHLRQLAAYGFVEEEPAARRRPRALVARRARRHAPRHGARRPRRRAVRDAFLRAVALRHGQATLDAVDALATLEVDVGPGWHAGSTISDMALRLTLDEARELIAKLDALIEGYRRDAPATRDPADGTRRVVVHYHVLPQARTEAG